jgi:hypothetical protein
MGIWLQGGELVINDTGSPFDCDHCPCDDPPVEYPLCNPCDDETIPRKISVTFGYDGSSTGGFDNTTDEGPSRHGTWRGCLDACTNPPWCDQWACPPAGPAVQGSNYCPVCGYPSGVMGTYPCCDNCSAMGGPHDLFQEERSICSTYHDGVQAYSCAWEGDNDVCCNEFFYLDGGVDWRSITICPYNKIYFIFTPPQCNSTYQVPGNTEYWNAALELRGDSIWGGFDQRWWVNTTDILYDVSADPTPWPLDCSQLSNKSWMTFGPNSDVQQSILASHNWGVYFNCPCDVGDADGQQNTIQAKVTMG